MNLQTEISCKTNFAASAVTASALVDGLSSVCLGIFEFGVTKGEGVAGDKYPLGIVGVLGVFEVFRVSTVSRFKSPLKV